MLKKRMSFISAETPRMGFSMNILRGHTIKMKKKSHTKPIQLIFNNRKKKLETWVGLEPGTFRVERSTADKKKKRRAKTNSRGGLMMFHPRRKTPSIQMEAKNWDTKINPGREMLPEMMDFPFLRGYLLLYLLTYFYMYSSTYCCTHVRTVVRSTYYC